MAIRPDEVHLRFKGSSAGTLNATETTDTTLNPEECQKSLRLAQWMLQYTLTPGDIDKENLKQKLLDRQVLLNTPIAKMVKRLQAEPSTQTTETDSSLPALSPQQLEILADRYPNQTLTDLCTHIPTPEVLKLFQSTGGEVTPLTLHSAFQALSGIFVQDKLPARQVAPLAENILTTVCNILEAHPDYLVTPLNEGQAYGIEGYLSPSASVGITPSLVAFTLNSAVILSELIDHSRNIWGNQNSYGVLLPPATTGHYPLEQISLYQDDPSKPYISAFNFINHRIQQLETQKILTPFMQDQMMQAKAVYERSKEKLIPVEELVKRWQQLHQRVNEAMVFFEGNKRVNSTLLYHIHHAMLPFEQGLLKRTRLNLAEDYHRLRQMLPISVKQRMPQGKTPINTMPLLGAHSAILNAPQRYTPEALAAGEPFEAMSSRKPHQYTQAIRLHNTLLECEQVYNQFLFFLIRDILQS